VRTKAKKMELDQIKQKENLKIMYVLNKQRRKKLGYKTLEEVFFINFEIENSRIVLAC
jgi:IS30 family transposase